MQFFRKFVFITLFHFSAYPLLTLYNVCILLFILLFIYLGLLY